MLGAGPSSAFLPGDKHPGLALSPECAGQAPAVAPGLKACPYSHAASPTSSSAAPGSPLPTSLDFCKTLPKQFKSMCRRATPPGTCPGAEPALSCQPAAPHSPRCPFPRSALRGAGLSPAGQMGCYWGSLRAGMAASPGASLPRGRQGSFPREATRAEVMGGSESGPGTHAGQPVSDHLCFCPSGVGLAVRLDDLRGLFQPE